MCSLPDFYNEDFVKARKPHKCCETGREIKPGEMYWRISGKWEDHLRTFCQSEAAYHFARFINGVKEGGDMSKYEGESCIAFGGIACEIPDDYDDEWALVKAGVVTRWTLPGEVPAYVQRQAVPHA